MEKMYRYAVYYAPRAGVFADHAASWLGCDAASALTKDPRRYGFHGTLRAPFRPAEGITEKAIRDQVACLAACLKPVVCDGLQVANLHGFVALTPDGGQTALQDMAATVVRGTNPLRASLTEAEISRRNPDQLTLRQRALLDDWGYPFVMEEFLFHLTLTDRLPQDTLPAVITALQAYFGPVLPRPFVIEDLCLFGEDAQGRFHLLHRYALTG